MRCGVQSVADQAVASMRRWIEEAHPTLRRNLAEVNGPLLQKLASLCYYHDPHCIEMLRGSKVVRLSMQ